MGIITKKSILYTLAMIVLGVLINVFISKLAGFIGLPLYLDSIGTMFAAVVGGLCPGMFVGFFSNMIGGISDSSTFYYGTINVLIAWIAWHGADRGWFNKFYKVFYLIPYYMVLSIPCSLLSYILFQKQIADNVTKPVVTAIHNLGLPILLSQIIGDYSTEIPDKLISVLVAFLLVKLVPIRIRSEYYTLSGRHIDDIRNSQSTDKKSLKRQVVFVILMSGILISLVAFSVSYKSYMDTKLANLADKTFDVQKLREETLLYSGKTLSAVFGLLLCIVSLAMVLVNRMMVAPLQRMTKEMHRFAYDSDEGRDESVEKLKKIDVRTNNEIEELYHAVLKTVEEIDEYIDMTTKQAKTISDFHVNIITTLADIVESRDETTGNHVKRTAKYCGMLAKALREKGKYTDIITDSFLDTLIISAPLHDIGKIKISDVILNKPGRLTDEEFEIIKTHTTLGREMLNHTASTMGENEYFIMANDIAYYHHEWYDGSEKGYPTRIKGDEIPLSARIMAVADVLDALLSKRPYKEGFSIEKAFSIMAEERGTHFDPEIIDAMFDCKDEIIEIKEKYK